MHIYNIICLIYMYIFINFPLFSSLTLHCLLSSISLLLSYMSYPLLSPSSLLYVSPSPLTLYTPSLLLTFLSLSLFAISSFFSPSSLFHLRCLFHLLAPSYFASICIILCICSLYSHVIYTCIKMQYSQMQDDESPLDKAREFDNAEAVMVLEAVSKVSTII